MSVVILDGKALARARQPGIAARGRTVRAERGRSARLLLLAFNDAAGRAPHVAGKQKACAAVHVEAIPLLLDGAVDTQVAIKRLLQQIEEHSPDAVFLQFPFPPRIDAEALAAAVPVELDVDVMTAAGIRQYFADPAMHPPVTVSAGLVLLDAHAIDVAGVSGVVIAEPGPFAAMFREAFVRRGAHMLPVLELHASVRTRALRDARLVVVSAARPGIIGARQFATGSIVIDAGYFNPGAVGDVDVAGGIDHLAAFAPVPGGIGPMTVSVLVERVVKMAGG